MILFKGCCRALRRCPDQQTWLGDSINFTGACISHRVADSDGLLPPSSKRGQQKACARLQPRRRTHRKARRKSSRQLEMDGFDGSR